jgi:hypothetical protein
VESPPSKVAIKAKVLLGESMDYKPSLCNT